MNRSTSLNENSRVALTQPRRWIPARELVLWIALVAVSSVLGACARSSQPNANVSQSQAQAPMVVEDPPAWDWIDAGRYRLQFSKLTSLRNTGLQLPVVSPDGQWIVALDCANVQSLDPDATLTGHTLTDTRLIIYNTTDEEVQPRVIATGA